MAGRLVQLARFALLLVTAGAVAAVPAQADRLKEMVQVEGARDNQLIGYGLVGGLAGTGDQTTQVPYTVQAIQNMMRQMGLSLNPQAFLQPTAVAAVMVTADLPAFVQVGQKIDVTVSAMGNAKSLRGGVLLMTELRGADGQVYAIAQGSLLVSGFEASGQAASTTVNIPTVAQIPNGAIIERSAKSTFSENGTILLDLDQRSFGNAARIADAINGRMGPIAQATGPAQVMVRAPPSAPAQVRFIADLLDINLSPEAPVAEVVIDAQSGTVVLGEDVKIGPAAVAYGSLAVTVNENSGSVAAGAVQQRRHDQGGAAHIGKGRREDSKNCRADQCAAGLGYRAQSERDRCDLVGPDRDPAGAEAVGLAARTDQGDLKWISVLPRPWPRPAAPTTSAG